MTQSCQRPVAKLSMVSQKVRSKTIEVGCVSNARNLRAAIGVLRELKIEQAWIKSASNLLLLAWISWLAVPSSAELITSVISEMNLNNTFLSCTPVCTYSIVNAINGLGLSDVGWL